MSTHNEREAYREHTHLHDALQVLNLRGCLHAGLSVPLRLRCKMLSMRLCLHVSLLVGDCLGLYAAKHNFVTMLHSTSCLYATS